MRNERRQQARSLRRKTTFDARGALFTTCTARARTSIKRPPIFRNSSAAGGGKIGGDLFTRPARRKIASQKSKPETRGFYEARNNVESAAATPTDTCFQLVFRIFRKPGA